jgi:hypothetical protein
MPNHRTDEATDLEIRRWLRLASVLIARVETPTDRVRLLRRARYWLQLVLAAVEHRIATGDGVPDPIEDPLTPTLPTLTIVREP